MSVRRAVPGDAAKLLDLYRVLAGFAPVADAAAVRAVLEHPGTDIFWREDAGEALAMVTLHVLPNVTQAGRPYALIENVVTAPRARMKGHGREVMQAAMQVAWDRDAYKIMLLTGQTVNARAFYEPLGFSADEKWGMTLRRAPLREGT